ncbi:carbohydrate-binding module family 48 protein [Teratosphaeria destructans]|uniref:Carbohydrate-binding module family 48 protein n=1 Tax=Teratosphaeria destructans TaxID=418781 RepID=A0A9W7SIU0_9PEZI|nr:carbohydrate-binding module family 48 protein [Teratosphaeria destructans]
MGNSQSNEEAKSPGSAQKSLRHRESKASVRKHAAASSSQSAATKQLAATLVPASSTASTSTSNAHAQGATVAAHSPSSSHSRARSITTTAATPKIRAEDFASSGKSEQSAMGNAESKIRPPSRSATLPPFATPSEERAKPSPISKPVDVPQPHDGLNEKETFAPSGVPNSESPYAQSNAPRYDRPPRLPLPIEEEPLTPGSPILSPQQDFEKDVSPHLEHQDTESSVPRRSSMLSSTTVDDEDDGDNDVLAPEQSQAPQVLVPTPVHYKGPGEKVYVTGTFVNWERKFKLHRQKDRAGFAATLQLKPGTHHIKFLVDGDMVTNDELPTTVDYTNILVNYIEVVAPLPGTIQRPAPAKPMDIPGAALTTGQATSADEAAGRPLDIRTQARSPETETDIPETKKPESIPIPQAAQTPPKRAEQPSQVTPPPQKKAPPKKKVPRPHYTNAIPQFFLDQDLNDPQDERYQRASRVVQNLPQPPTLPMFLGKSILNATTPHKDDASVLTMPNHTVLNHLATSSIKNGVLATSGTTRYKRKFLTTIMHKPTSDDG